MKPVLVLRHAAHEVIGSLEDTLRNAGVVHITVDQFVKPLKDFDPSQWGGLIVMGGPMNVDETERFPFLTDEPGYLRQAVAAELPVLGICLGSQLLAKSLGSKVYPNRVKEIGWSDIDFTPAAADDPLFAECRRVENVFQWHGDTFDMPAGAVQLASGPNCRNQIFRYGRRAYGIQCHLEMTESLIDWWLTDEHGCAELAKLDYIDPAAIRGQTPRRIGPLLDLANRVFSHFAAMCLDQK
jgi:GMP synthase (glutamine-hydrolysing)